MKPYDIYITRKACEVLPDWLSTAVIEEHWDKSVQERANALMKEALWWLCAKGEKSERADRS